MSNNNNITQQFRCSICGFFTLIEINNNNNNEINEYYINNDLNLNNNINNNNKIINNKNKFKFNVRKL